MVQDLDSQAQQFKPLLEKWISTAVSLTQPCLINRFYWIKSRKTTRILSA
jgi:hypothetical protein